MLLKVICGIQVMADNPDIYASKGNMWYWMREDFNSYGDAYDW